MARFNPSDHKFTYFSRPGIVETWFSAHLSKLDSDNSQRHALKGVREDRNIVSSAGSTSAINTKILVIRLRSGHGAASELLT
ncbi:hypothetical protein M378DRAFT_168787 [Amanita muscaria Koide BX008]|uniref:Uncharacterized protein n=1 Tax=Amanita muscaria (strain Koide BX008) TaxID=946122 RepID=A0A0C2WTW8_AMAMK|nr:hypothetical protein M378DRAFT_168787 [Amanita muscaria Koide BX008]